MSRNRNKARELRSTADRPIRHAIPTRNFRSFARVRLDKMPKQMRYAAFPDKGAIDFARFFLLSWAGYNEMATNARWKTSPPGREWRTRVWLSWICNKILIISLHSRIRFVMEYLFHRRPVVLAFQWKFVDFKEVILCFIVCYCRIVCVTWTVYGNVFFKSICYSNDMFM